jgi:glyoxylase-like metal-dependent hydrolase (beta-lactamase superfamily II)
MKAVKVSIFTAGFCACPEHIAISGGRWRNIRFPAMFALFEHPQWGAMLFDTGYSERFFTETRRFPNRLYRLLTPVTLRAEQLAVNQLASLNIRASDVTKVFISHFHADHIAALGDFPHAKYVYLPQAFASVRDLRGFGALSRAHLPGLIPGDFSQRAAPLSADSGWRSLPPEFAPFTRGCDLLGDESLLAVELPGHAAGQMGLFACDESGSVYFFVADAAWLGRSIREDRAPHQIANLLFPDPPVYRATLNKLHTFAEQHTGVRVIPSHCEATLQKYAALVPVTGG